MTEEFQQRSEQAFAARTGKELTALLADLPVEQDQADIAVVKHDDLAPARPRVVVVGATIAAACFGLIAVANALTPGPTLQQRELAQQIFRQHGINIPLPPASSFNWPGTITPAIIAVLFVALIIVLRMTRAKRGPRP